MATGKGDVTTRVEEEIAQSPEEAVLSRLPTDFPPLPEDSDEESDELKNFRIDHAWDTLFKLNGLHQIMLSPDCQKNLGIEVGVNISQEFPWRQIKFRTLVDYYFDRTEEGQNMLKDFEDFKSDDLILLGYVPVLTQNNIEIDIADPFILYDNHFAQRKASQIIKNIQIYEKWLLSRTVSKKSQPWKSLGSEKLVDLTLKADKTQVVDVELQSRYPMSLTTSKFINRTSNDVRDGYVELIPGERKFENISRRRIHAGTQQSPARVTLEQQTDPTFPTNAWSQYLYEITEEGDGLDEESEDEEEKPVKKNEPIEQPIEKPIEISDQVKFLMNSLEFNQVDMYRNDYPLISSVVVPKYSNPYLEELLCFAEISKSLNRYVCGVDWYPTISGLLVTSYTFTTPSISIDVNDKTDFVEQTIFEQNPVLMWSFSDSLQPKLDFQSPRQVTCLSFCPYNGNILIGGTINGQIVIWDLQNRVEKLDYEEMLTTAQTKYRIMMLSFLDWSKEIDEQYTIYPAIVSALDTSQNGPITCIKWLPRNQTITADGKHIETLKHSNRFFITNSIDGTLAVWNLDINLDKKISQQGPKRQLPKQLMSSESIFKKYDRIFKPIFKICYNEPLTGTICETAQFLYKPYNYTKSLRDFTIKYPIKVITEVVVNKSKSQIDNNENPLVDKIKTHKLLSSTFFGQIASYTWDGLDFDAGAPVNKEEIIISSKFANCHDGPILALEQNPHYQKIFASVGRYVLAIWKEDFLLTPIMWRIRPCELTNIKWSLDRPSVLFITRTDGVFESWDILARDDEPILADAIGGGIVSTLSEHRPSIPKKVLGIGDYNSSFRMIALPANFEGQDQNEKTRLKNYIEKEVSRKQRVIDWEANWLVKNADILEAKRVAEEEALRELEYLKKEAEEAARAAEAEPKKKSGIDIAATKKTGLDLPEIFERKWDEMNLKRLMDVLMLRKQVNAEKLERETVLEKKRLAYEKSKRQALKRKYLKKIDEDIATVRARILPAAIEDVNRIELVTDSVEEILTHSPKYSEIETESIEFMHGIDKYGDVSYAEFFKRGRDRRKLLNKSLGSNTDRVHFYNNLKMGEQLNELNFGCDSFIAMENRSRDFGASGDNISMEQSWTDLDQIPVKEINAANKLAGNMGDN